MREAPWFTSSRATGVAIGLALPVCVAAQGLPGKPLIEQAADRINSLAPPAMPQQTIAIGSYNGATKRFDFSLEDYYPPSVPPAKRQENGGDIPPQHRADINSMNVTYTLGVANAPSDLRIALEVTEANGQKVEKQATIASGIARVSFTPQSFARQTLRIHGGGQDVAALITPHLREQLGAFIVPHLLVAIVYEPPGTASSSRYSQTKTTNTVISWSDSRTAGVVEVDDPDALINAVSEKAAGALGEVNPVMGAALTVIMGLRSQTSVTMTTSSTVTTTGSSGVSFALTVGFTTGAHKYPGEGDLFIVLHDVLFAYLAAGGKVRLAPLAYSGTEYMTAAEIRQKLPAALAEQFIALDPHLNPRAQTAVAGGRPIPVELRLAGFQRAGLAARLQPFAPFEQVACKDAGSTDLTFAQTDFQSSGTSRAESQTWVTHANGLGPQIFGGSGDQLASTTYTTAKESGTSQSQGTTITLSCASADQFWVHVYLDNLFRSFYTLRGDPIASVSSFTGTAEQANGQPQANTLMRLSVGGHSYVVRSDASGTFSFPLQALPKGAATLQAGAQSYRLTFDGAQRNVLLKGGAVTERPVAPPGRPAVPTRPKPGV
ncbi:MAG: hypothetical protein M3068_06455 [Gemmatimonadota bacterium]|nr:hypothetical protein [Gemmatimonadota bacterium]